MKLTPPTLAAAVVLIAAGGFMAGRVSSPSPAAGASAGPAETRSPRSISREGLPGQSEGAAGRSAGRPTRPDKSMPQSREERLAKLASIMHAENPLDRNRALLAYIDQLGPEDFDEALAGFKGLELDDARRGEFSLLLTAWAQADPLKAMAFAASEGNGGFARDAVLTSWATHDPEAAIRWAQENFLGEGANPYLPGIIRGLASADPARATELLASLPRSGERGQGLDFLLPHLLAQGSSATRAWIDGLADPSLRDGAMTRAAENLAGTDPAGTVSWLLANPGQASQRRMDDVYEVWAAKDSQAALGSLAAMPAGNDRSNALRGIVGTMAQQDPQAALNVMNRYPNDVSDPIVQNFVRHSVANDPVTAVSQIPRIANDREREQTYRRALDGWYDRDPASAMAWARTNPLPDSVRNHLNRRQTGQ